MARGYVAGRSLGPCVGLRRMLHRPSHTTWLRSLVTLGRPSTPTPKVTLNRFMSLIQERQQQKKVWAARLAAYELVALELGMLKTKKVQSLMVQQGGRSNADDQEERAARATSSRRPDAVDSAVRKSCANGLVISIYLLNAPHSYRRLTMFLEVSSHVERWHSKQLRSCRSAGGSLEWFVEQTTGNGTMRLLNLLWAGLSMSAALSRQGFWLPNADQQKPEESLAASDDGLARELGCFTLALLHRRISHTLPLLLGWPTNALRMLAGATAAAADAKRLLDAYSHYKSLCRAVTQHDFLVELRKRSIFGRPVVMQLAHALETNNGNVSEKLLNHLRCYGRRLTSTTCVEGGFNHMKTDRATAKRKKQARPSRAWSAVLHKKVLPHRHGWDEVQPSSALHRRAAELPDKVYHLKETTPSMNLEAIMGPRPGAEWYSPGVGCASVPIADLCLLEAAAASGDWRSLANSWLGCLAKWEHQILLRDRGQENSCWMFALGPIGDSAVAVWPARARSLQSSSRRCTFFEPEVSGDRPAFLPIVCLDRWEACQYEWRSPASMKLHFPDAALPLRVLPLQTTAPEPLLTCAARQGFWSLPLPALQGIYEALTALVPKILPQASDEAIEAILSRRIVALSKKASPDSVEEVLQLDEAADFLEKEDVKEIKKLGGQVETSRQSLEEFRTAVVKRKASARGPGVARQCFRF